MSNEDKAVLLMKIQEWLDRIWDIKVDKKSFSQQWWVKVYNWIYTISDASKLTADDKDKLAYLIARKTFINNWLPDCWLLKQYEIALRDSLDNLWFDKLKFSLWQWLNEEKWIINLTLLWEAQLMQLLMHPDNMLNALIAKQMIRSNSEDIATLAYKLDMYKDLWISDEYQKLLTWITDVIRNWENYTTNELVWKLSWIIKNSWILEQWYVKNK